MMAAEATDDNSMRRGVALIVDDEIVNLRLLEALLKTEGFTTAMAHNGAMAVERFADGGVDIVFMDVMMPEMDGYEATRRIKAFAGDDFVPVIFLTALSDNAVLVKCIEAGGDDFLSKPFNFVVLKARIRAMERLRDMHRMAVSRNAILAELHERDQLEQHMAERIFTRVVAARNVATRRVSTLQWNASTFSGDLVLTAYLPDGGLRILLADFTGHGLTAAIAALPVAEIFHNLTWDGANDLDLLAEMNRRLHALLPVERFMCACLASISADGSELRFWNGGMPPAWLLGPEGRQSLESHALPLGIIADMPLGDSIQNIPLNRNDRLLLLSDGVTDARSAEGRMWGENALITLLDDLLDSQPILPVIEDALGSHCSNHPLVDDLTAVEVDLKYPME